MKIDPTHRQILEAALKQASKYERKYFRTIFEACAANGYGVARYGSFLDRVKLFADRAARAIVILEGREQ